MTPDPFQSRIDLMCIEAKAQIREWINRSAGQHVRRMRESWA